MFSLSSSEALYLDSREMLGLLTVGQVVLLTWYDDRQFVMCNLVGRCQHFNLVVQTKENSFK